LEEVGAVEPGAVDPHDDPVGSRVGEGPFRDLEMVADDRDRTHEPAT
jgi:hypothetical protein